jgi:hypothetical protein
MFRTSSCIPKKNLPYSLIVVAATGNDKTAGGLRAILCQRDQKGNNKVIACASRQLLKHKKTQNSSRNGSHSVGNGTLRYIPKRENLYSI